MPADPSSRNDPLRHRAPPPSSFAEPPSAAPPPDRGQELSDGVAAAKTVIRGSSRVPPAGSPLSGTPAVVAKVLVGQRLNQYLIEELIGGGGMGAVFRAHDDRLDRAVAIKVIPYAGDDPDLQRRFRNEAQSAAKLDHPGIARVYDAGSHDEWHYIVFEYIKGTNIRDRVVQSGALSIDDAVYYTAQLAGAIEHASSRGIVHRDIKPSNVIVGDDDKLKLVDMGLARSAHLELSEDLTASGVTLGTFDYISPEQAHDPRAADVRSDIYSLGCTLYFMLTGSPPYPGGTMAQKIISHRTSPPPNVQQIRAAVSDHLAAVLLKMLAKSPEHRYRSANDLLADLREVARRDGLRKAFELAPLPAAGAAAAPSALDRYWPWIVALGLIGLSAAWLRLESAALRDEPQIPETATAPLDLTDLDRPGQSSSRRSAVNDPEPSAAGIEAASRPATGPRSERRDSAGETVNPADPIAPASERRGDEPAPAGAPESPRSRDRSGETTEQSTRRVEMPADRISQAPLVRVVSQVNGRQRDRDGALLAQSLSQALELAAQAGSGGIEIAAPVLASEPVKIDLRQPLIIRSSVGRSAILLEGSGATGQSRPPIWIKSGQVELQDLHLRWGRGQTPVGASALIRLEGDCDLNLVRCSVTIPGPHVSGERFALSIDDDPSRFDTSRVDGAVTLGDADSRLTRIELRDSIIRGDLTMLSIGRNSTRPLERKVALTWDNGLLAITGRMIQASGTRVDSSGRPAGSIELSLSRLTAHAPRGLAQIQVGPEARVSTPIDRQSFQCLYLIDPETPHVEYRGLESLEDWPEVLLMRGTGNWYATNRRWLDPMLRLVTAGGRAAATAMQSLGTEPPWWLQDRSPHWTIPPWSNPDFSQLRASQRSAEDYLHEAETVAGFDLVNLPQIPANLGDPAPNADRGSGGESEDPSSSATES